MLLKGPSGPKTKTGTPAFRASLTAEAEPGESEEGSRTKTTRQARPERTKARLRTGPAARPKRDQAAENTSSSRPQAAAAAAAKLSAPEAPPDTTTHPAGREETNCKTGAAEGNEREPTTPTRAPAGSEERKEESIQERLS